MSVLSLILVFLAISSGGFLCYVTGKGKYETMLPVTCMGMILLLFLFGIMGALKAGFILVCAVCLCIYILFFVCMGIRIRKNGIRAFQKDFLSTVGTPAAAAFLVLFCALVILNRGRLCATCDEFSHWGLIVKQMAYTDALGTDPGAVSIHFKSYPPAMALFQYFFEKMNGFCTGVWFSEWHLYLAYQVLSYALLLPFLSGLDPKKPGFYAALLLMFFSPVFIFRNAFSEIYIDAFIGLAAGAGLACVFIRERDGLQSLTVLLTSAVLVLSKEIGILFASAVSACYVLSVFLDDGSGRKWGQRIAAVGHGLSAVLIPRLLWETHLTANAVQKNFSGRIDFGSLLRVILGKEVSYRTEAIRNFGKALVKTPYPLPELLLLFSGILLLILLLKKEKKKEIQRYRMTAVVCAVLAVCYIVGTCVAYMYKFSEYEALRLASFDRYLRVILNTVWYLLVLPLMQCLHLLKKNRIPLVAAFLAVAGICGIRFGRVKGLLTGETVRESVLEREKDEELIDRVQVYATEEDRIFVVAQETMGDEYQKCGFTFFPALLQQSGIGSIGEPFYEGDIWTELMDMDTFRSRLEKDGFDFVALYKLNAYFSEHFSGLFKNPEDIREKTLFWFDREAGYLIKCE